jgi:ABC-type polysaccharide/polyol phosphate transport system ATPase subunit
MVKRSGSGDERQLKHMSENAILVEDLSKRYLIGHRSSSGHKYTALRDVLVRETRNFMRKATDVISGRQVVQGDEVEEFWALRDLSFDVRQGEVLGIIGRNGAGKSTLLKILSRITEPTKGRIVLTGRLASLLEVGTGFHPELTGRENIYLNGAILGMTRREIRVKFDEIVAFAEVEKFLDTPVKFYSSGMYVRLAFAVAAHLEPEILIIDEVLAVGDAKFHDKCIAKMHEVSSGLGRTVLLVSHDVAAISALCARAFLLDQGRLVASGPVNDVLRTYHEVYIGGTEVVRVVTPALRWRGIQNRAALDRLRNDDYLEFELGFETGEEPIDNMQIDIALFDQNDRWVLHCKSGFVRDPISVPANTPFVVSYALGKPRLAPGHYRMAVYVVRGAEELCWIMQIDACRVTAASPFLPGSILDEVRGSIVPEFRVEVALNSRPGRGSI